MGKINTYQQSKLASARVGVVRPDRSGQIIGDAVSNAANKMADMFRQREVVASNLKATNSYNTFRAETAVGKMELQRQFQDNPQLYPAESKKLYETLKRKYEGNLGGEAASIFSQRADAFIRDNTIGDIKWQFDRETENALVEVGTMVNNYAINATTHTTTDPQTNIKGFFSEADTFKADFETAAMPAVSPKTADKALRQANSNAAAAFIEANISTEGGVNPTFFREYLDKVPEDKTRLFSYLTPEQARKYEKKIVEASDYYTKYTITKNLEDRDGSATADINDILSEDPTRVNVLKYHQRLSEAENTLDFMVRSGAPKEDIQEQENRRKLASVVYDFASKRFDKSVVEKEDTKVQLEIELDALMRGSMLGAKGKDREGIERSALEDRNLSKSKEAPENYTEYMQQLYDYKLSVLDARNRGEINNTTMQTQLAKVDMYLKNAQEFDRMKEGSHPIAKAYNSIDAKVTTALDSVLPSLGGAERVGRMVLGAFPAGMVTAGSAAIAPGSKSDPANLRSAIRAKVIDDTLSNIVRMQGILGVQNLTDEVIEQAVVRAWENTARMLYDTPEIGGTVTVRGAVKVFQGFDPKTGSPSYVYSDESKKQVKEAMKN